MLIVHFRGVASLYFDMAKCMVWLLTELALVTWFALLLEPRQFLIAHCSSRLLSCLHVVMIWIWCKHTMDICQSYRPGLLSVELELGTSSVRGDNLALWFPDVPGYSYFALCKRSQKLEPKGPTNVGHPCLLGCFAIHIGYRNPVSTRSWRWWIYHGAHTLVFGEHVHVAL